MKVGGSTLQDVKHTWDAIGNLTQRENVKEIETEKEKESFAYDFLDRLTSQDNFLFKFGDTGEASSRVSTPWHATADSSGNTWIADWDNCRIAKYDSSGVYQSSFGSDKLSSPTGVTRDSSGNFFVTDYWNSSVYKYDSSGNYVLEWGGYGTGDGQFRYPTDIVYNGTYLYVIEQFGNRVQYFEPTSTAQVGKWGSFGTDNGKFRYAYGIGTDSSGNIYVADTANNRVQKFNSTGTHQATWGGTGSGSGNGEYNAPKDVDVDSSGNVFIADTGNNRIQKLSSSGTFIMKWGTSGSNPGQFSGPYGINLNSSRIWVVDTGNNRLQTYDLSTTAGWTYNQIGNITYRDGAAYTYGTKPHAVTAAGTKSYVYDSNGSMTTWDTKTLTWDVENRLTAVTGGISYTYDGDGFRVTKTENGETILYVNKYYEKNLSTGLVTLYYYFGDKLVAYKEMDFLRYVHQDHLTGTSVTSSTAGASVGSIRYKPFGESRSFTGSAPAHKFTGQRLDEVGLYYYGARYYDPGLGRFVSADTYIQQTSGFNLISPPLTVNMIFTELGSLSPGVYPKVSSKAPLNPQTLCRYSYVLNNPLRYTDPYGWWTFGLGLNLNVGVGGGFTLSGMVVFDLHGGIALAGNAGLGGYGGASGNLAVQVQVIPNADRVQELEGLSVASGGSVTIGPTTPISAGTLDIGITGGAELVLAESYQGVNFQGGLGVSLSSPVEMHSLVENTRLVVLSPGIGYEQ